MKKKYALILVIFLLLCSSCSSTSETLDPRISEEIEKYNWEYTSTDTTYESDYESDYWNYLDDRYEKMLYEATVNADFSEEIQKHIYLFYGDEVNDYSFISVLKAIQFARFDHPELELMNMDFNNGSSSSAEEGILYQSVSFHSFEYDDYESKLEEVNSEIKDLVNKVNCTTDIVEKHRLIFDWITTNVNYLKTDEAVGIVDFYNEEFILARTETDSTQNIYGAIVNKTAICDGIADAYKYICNMCDLECIVVDGYISNISEQLYHAWNLVKVNNTWYLVDATWDLGKNYSEYFMVKDLNKGNRTPFNIGYSLPGYEDVISNQITFEKSAEANILKAENGIEVELTDDNYSMSLSSNGEIYVNFSPSGIEKYLEGNEDISTDILIKTNAQITSIEYFSYQNELIKVAEETSELIFPDEIDDTYVSSIRVSLSFNGNIYELVVKKGGA